MKKQIRTSSNEIQRLIQEAIRARKNSVFSTDSEAGKKYKEMGYERPDSDRKLKDGWELKDFGTTGEPWKNNEESAWDKDSKRDKFAMDEFGEEEKYSRMYDENPEGEENMYFGDPDMESDDEEEGIYERRQLPKRVSLSESQLREFISYSVAQLLKESMPIYMRRNGEVEYEGEDGSPYGGDSIVIQPDELEEYVPEDLELPKIRVYYDVTEGMKGDGYMQPDDPDEYEVTDWEVINKEKYPPEVLEAIKNYMENDFDIEEEVSGHRLWEEKEKDDDDDECDYGGGWDASFNKRATDRPKIDHEKNGRGHLAHFPGKKDDSKKKDKENVNEEAMGNDEVAERFPKKASGTFTMNTRSGKTDKYKVFVEKTPEEELLTDIFIYDPMDKEWYPQAEYVVGIEEYLNGSWLPYWETFNGDVSIRALANCFGKVVKLWKKVGYLHDEDDEIPFRYAGDVKGLGGKRY